MATRYRCWIIDAIGKLQDLGYFLDFSLIAGKLFCVQCQCYLEAQEFEIREIYRFKNGEAVCEETILFAIESNIQPVKGILYLSRKTVTERLPGPSPVLINYRRFARRNAVPLPKVFGEIVVNVETVQRGRRANTKEPDIYIIVL